MPAKSGISGTLYTYPNNPRADLIRISAEYGSSNVTVASHTDDTLSTFPLSRVPAFKTDEGLLFDTMAIATLVGNSELRGCSEFERASITQWMNVAELELYPSACQILYPVWGLMPNNKGAINKARENLNGFMASLNKYLESRTYLVGESVTLADLTLALYFRDLYNLILEEKDRDEHGNVTRWFNTIINQDEVTRVIGNTSLCTKAAQFDAKLFAQNNPKQKKEPAPKKEAAPKQQPKKEEPKPQQAKKPEVKKPFANLPKPKLDLDTFKRLYWNESTEVIMKYFDENFVEGEYSVYTSEYKYPEELKIDYMTNNLVKGMLQRLESMRKFAFGLLYVWGKAGDGYKIFGVWLGRGAGNFFEEDESWDVDITSYELTKLDMGKPEDHKLFADFVAGTLEEYKGAPFDTDHIF